MQKTQINQLGKLQHFFAFVRLEFIVGVRRRPYFLLFRVILVVLVVLVVGGEVELGMMGEGYDSGGDGHIY